MILYFSGTGNSKYVAQRMAEALNQSLLSMNDRASPVWCGTGCWRRSSPAQRRRGSS